MHDLATISLMLSAFFFAASALVWVVKNDPFGLRGGDEEDDD